MKRQRYLAIDSMNITWGLGLSPNTAMQDAKNAMIRCNKFRASYRLRRLNPKLLKLYPVTKRLFDKVKYNELDLEERLPMHKVNGVWDFYNPLEIS